MTNRDENLVEYAEGKRFRLEVATANLMRGLPEFTVTKTEATTRRRTLRELGYVVTIFRIAADGGLTHA